MERLQEVEYGVASNLQYKITSTLVNPADGVVLQNTDLYITLRIKSNLEDDELFNVTGIYNDVDAWDFSFTQEQSDLMTPDTWYLGFEVRVTNVTGQVVHRKTVSRKVIETGAKA